MATLAELQAGEQFPLIFQVVEVTADGVRLNLYATSSSPIANITVAPDGTWTGSTGQPLNQVPVTIVPGSSPVSVGDVLENNDTGETSVCRWSAISSDGSVIWSTSVNHTVVYQTAGWSVIGHAELT